MRAHFTKVFQTGQDRGELIVDIPAEEMASIAILNFLAPFSTGVLTNPTLLPFKKE